MSIEKRRRCPCDDVRMPAIRISCDLGAEAAVGTLATLVSALGVVSDAAMELGFHQAQAEADQAIGELLRRGGPRAVLDRARSREVPSASSDRIDPMELEVLADLDEFWWWDPEYARSRLSKLGPRRYARLVTSRLAGFDVPGQSPWEQVLRELRLTEAAALAPADTVRFGHFRYENPVDGQLLVDAGVALAGLGFLLGVMRDWSSRRRRESTRADAEERIQSSLADDMEDQVLVRRMVRRVALARLARGEPDLSSDTLDGILSDNVVAAIDRLAERDLQWDLLPDPGDDNASDSQ